MKQYFSPLVKYKYGGVCKHASWPSINILVSTINILSPQTYICLAKVSIPKYVCCQGVDNSLTPGSGIIPSFVSTIMVVVLKDIHADSQSEKVAVNCLISIERSGRDSHSLRMHKTLQKKSIWHGLCMVITYKVRRYIIDALIFRQR